MATGTLTVAAGTTLATLGNYWNGVSTPVYDGQLLTTTTVSQTQAAALPHVRFPGGSSSDVFHWAGSSWNTASPQTNQAFTTNGGYMTPLSTPGSGGDFTVYMTTLVIPNNIKCMITANYGSDSTGNVGGNPAEAAAWAQYVVTKGWTSYCTNWEIGNENYGSWEADQHGANGSAGVAHDPATYAAQWIRYYNAIKAVSATFQVGVVLVAPAQSPVNTSWNATVMAAVGSLCDFVIIHYYPIGKGHESDADILSASYSQFPSAPANSDSFGPNVMINGGTVNGSVITGVKGLLTTYCGSNSHGAANVPIYMTEINIDPQNPPPATTGIVGGLFCADMIPTCIEQGAAGTTWWDLHNGADTSVTNASSGSLAWGDFGVLSSNVSYTSTHGGPTPGIADYTAYPPYYALQLLNQMGKPADALVSTTSNQTLVRTHAVKQVGGKLVVLMINTDPTNSYTETVTLTGFTADRSITVQRYAQTQVTALGGPASSTVTGTSSTVFTDTIAPYSINLYTLNPAGALVNGQVITCNGTSVTPTTVSPNGSITLSTTVNSVNTTAALGAQWLIYNPSATLQAPLPQVTTGALTANTPVAITQTYVVPANAAAGTWTIRAQVMSNDYITTTYFTDPAAISFLVQASSAGGGTGTPVSGVGTDSQIALASPAVIQRVVTFPYGGAGNSEVAPVVVAGDPGTGSIFKFADDANLKTMLTLEQARGVNPIYWDANPGSGTVRTANGDTGWWDVTNSKYVDVWYNATAFTAVGGTGTLTLYIDHQPPAYVGTAFSIGLWVLPTPLTTTGFTTTNAQVMLGPGCVQNVLFGSKMRVRWAFTGATTYSTTLELGFFGKW